MAITWSVGIKKNTHIIQNSFRGAQIIFRFFLNLGAVKQSIRTKFIRTSSLRFSKILRTIHMLKYPYFCICSQGSLQKKKTEIYWSFTNTGGYPRPIYFRFFLRKKPDIYWSGGTPPVLVKDQYISVFSFEGFPYRKKKYASI